MKFVLLVLVLVAVVFGATEEQQLLTRLRSALGVEEKNCAGAGSTCYECKIGCLASQPCAATECQPVLTCCSGLSCNLMGNNNFWTFYSCQATPSQTSSGALIEIVG